MPDEIEADDHLAAAIELIGRTGATQLQVGYLHDHVPTEEAAWWAHAQYLGARVTAEGKRSPHAALDALLVQLLDGAVCRWCGRQVTNRKSKSPRRYCRYHRDGATYVRGCAGTHQQPTVPAAPWQRGGSDG